MNPLSGVGLSMGFHSRRRRASRALTEQTLTAMRSLFFFGDRRDGTIRNIIERLWTIVLIANLEDRRVRQGADAYRRNQ
jgi:hypothetical protein